MPDLSGTLEQTQAPSSSPRKSILFSPDNILDLVDCRIQADGLECSRPTITAHILRKVNQIFDVIQQAYWNAYLVYSRLLRSEATQEELDKALRACLSARELLAEAWMATKYFNCMLKDLDRSRDAMDLLTMSVPPFAAPLDESLPPSEGMSQGSMQRTYYSRIPAILRKLPETSPASQRVSLPDVSLSDISNTLANTRLGESSSSSGRSFNALVV